MSPYPIIAWLLLGGLATRYGAQLLAARRERDTPLVAARAAASVGRFGGAIIAVALPAASAPQLRLDLQSGKLDLSSQPLRALKARFGEELEIDIADRMVAFNQAEALVWLEKTAEELSNRSLQTFGTFRERSLLFLLVVSETAFPAGFDDRWVDDIIGESLGFAVAVPHPLYRRHSQALLGATAWLLTLLAFSVLAVVEWRSR